MNVDWIHAALGFMFCGLWIFIGWIMLYREESASIYPDQPVLRPHRRTPGVGTRRNVPWHFGRRQKTTASSPAEN